LSGYCSTNRNRGGSGATVAQRQAAGYTRFDAEDVADVRLGQPVGLSEILAGGGDVQRAEVHAAERYLVP